MVVGLNEIKRFHTLAIGTLCMVVRSHEIKRIHAGVNVSMNIFMWLCAYAGARECGCVRAYVRLVSPRVKPRE